MRREKHLGTFIVPGKPVPTARPRMNARTGWYVPKESKRAQADIYWLAHGAGIRLKVGRAYALTVRFYVYGQHGDHDNLYKTVLDGLFPRGKGQPDDRQVLQSHLTTVYTGRNEQHTVIVVEDIGDMNEIREEDRRCGTK